MTVTGVRKETLNPNVVIVLDVSRRIADDEAGWDEAFELADKISVGLGGESSVSLLAFNDNFAKIVQSNGDLTRIHKALVKLHSRTERNVGHNRSHLAVAVRRSAEDLRLGKGDSIIVVSSGGEPESFTSDKALEAMLSARRVRVFAAFPSPADIHSLWAHDEEDEHAAEQLTEFADDTGGLVHYLGARNLPAIEKLVGWLKKEAITPWVVQFTAPEALYGKLSINYRAAKPGDSSTLQIFAPAKLVSAPAGQPSAN